MQLLIIVLNKTEKLDTLLESFMEAGLTGATILGSTGMVSTLAKHREDYPIFGVLRYLADLDRAENKTIFMALRDERVEDAKEIVRRVVGDLTKPDTAVMFTLPILSAEGIES